MTLDLDDTIAAIASAAGSAARGIVRLSGAQSLAILERVFLSADGREVRSRTSPAVVRGNVVLDQLGEVPALAYLWPTQRSYTQQPAAELHLPGSPPVLEAALAAVCAAGARLARPGEFTLRAFLAGRLDLTQAEAVLGVIEAPGRQALAAALEQLAGGLAQPLSRVRERLLDLLAHLEAGLDFVEEDLEFITTAELRSQLVSAQAELAAVETQLAHRGEAGELPRVVLTGPPNAGKSSLLNALAGAAAAIVSPVAGTTRDSVTRRISAGGQEFVLVDTAGLDAGPAPDDIGALAQESARGEMQRAALVITCCDASQPALASLPPAIGLVAWTKCDLASASFLAGRCPDAIATSSRTGQGLAELKALIAARLEALVAKGGVVASTADRCRESVRLAVAALERAAAAVDDNLGQELVAAEVRLALEELGQVVGAVYTEDVLDRVFSRFCIGK